MSEALRVMLIVFDILVWMIAGGFAIADILSLIGAMSFFRDSMHKNDHLERKSDLEMAIMFTIFFACIFVITAILVVGALALSQGL